MGAQKNRLIETVLLSTHNIRFGGEIRKLILKYALLSGGLLACLKNELTHRRDKDKYQNIGWYFWCPFEFFNKVSSNLTDEATRRLGNIQIGSGRCMVVGAKPKWKHRRHHERTRKEKEKEKQACHIGRYFITILGKLYIHTCTCYMFYNKTVLVAIIYNILFIFLNVMER